MDPEQEQLHQPSGFLYFLMNPAMPSYLKIGQTGGNPYERAQQLFTTGLPKPFKVLRAYFVTDRISAEKIAHTVLEKHRTKEPVREFFEIDISTGIEIVEPKIAHLIDKTVHCCPNDAYLERLRNTQERLEAEVHRQSAVIEHLQQELKKCGEKVRSEAQMLQRFLSNDKDIRSQRDAEYEMTVKRAERAESLVKQRLGQDAVDELNAQKKADWNRIKR